jgi:hypothetical protein
MSGGSFLAAAGPEDALVGRSFPWNMTQGFARGRVAHDEVLYYGQPVTGVGKNITISPEPLEQSQYVLMQEHVGWLYTAYTMARQVVWLLEQRTAKMDPDAALPGKLAEWKQIADNLHHIDVVNSNMREYAKDTQRTTNYYEHIMVRSKPMWDYMEFQIRNQTSAYNTVYRSLVGTIMRQEMGMDEFKAIFPDIFNQEQKYMMPASTPMHHLYDRISEAASELSYKMLKKDNPSLYASKMRILFDDCITFSHVMMTPV